MSFAATNAPYDTWAEAYRDWWGPILAPWSVRVLDWFDGSAAGDPILDGAPFHLVDVGTGTGALAVAALERWPQARVTGVDPAARMLELAAGTARQRGSGFAERLDLLVGSADRLPLPDASVDVAVSSFVIQLAPSRAAALREIARVVRPGGRFACLTWQADSLTFEPDDAFMLAVDELDLELPPLDGHSRPYPSPGAAARELRRAGFVEARAETVWLEHRYTPESYLGVLERWSEAELFEGLGPRLRLRLRSEALRRMRAVPREAFVWRRPLVSVVGRRR